MNKDMNKRPFSSRKRALVGFAVVCVVLLAALGLAVTICCVMPSVRQWNIVMTSLGASTTSSTKTRSCAPEADSLQRHQALRDTFVTMPTGERHHATYILAPPTHRPRGPPRPRL